MLLTKEVEIGLSGTNVKWFENLGYEIPKYYHKKKRKMLIKLGTKIIAKVEDLPKSSRVKVNVKCDCEYCKNPYLKPMTWDAYKRHVKKDDKYYCRKCAVEIFAREKMNKTKLKNSESFKVWCIRNNRQDVLDRWDYELNKYNPDEVCFSSFKKYYFKCPKGLHKSELQHIYNFTHGENSILCKACNSFAQWGIDTFSNNFLEKYWDYEKNTVDPWKIDKCSNMKIYIKCQEKDYHGNYNATCKRFVRGDRCPYCTTRNGKLHQLDSLGMLYPEVFLIWSNKNKKSPYKYTPFSNQKVWWKCPNGKHDDYYRKICDSNSICHFRCPKCVKERKESFLQEKIRLYLNKLGYEILHEYDCTLKCINPKTKYQLPYDNEILELKFIIEVHGSQHYIESSGKWFNNNFNFHKQKLYDRYKRIFAKLQGYFYLEIPYWTDDKDETWKKLIDDKLNEIIK